MDEHQPVDPGEFVYRRIHRTYYHSGLPLSIQPAAFRPNPNDTTGAELRTRIRLRNRAPSLLLPPSRRPLIPAWY